MFSKVFHSQRINYWQFAHLDRSDKFVLVLIGLSEWKEEHVQAKLWFKSNNTLFILTPTISSFSDNKFFRFFTPLYHYRFFASWHTRPSPISGKNKRFFFVLRIRLIRRDIKFDSRYLFLAGGVCGKCKTPSRNNLIKKWTTCKNVAWNLPSYVSSMDLTWKLSLNRFVISFLNVKFLIILTFKS